MTTFLFIALLVTIILWLKQNEMYEKMVGELTRQHDVEKEKLQAQLRKAQLKIAELSRQEGIPNTGLLQKASTANDSDKEFKKDVIKVA